MSPKLIQIKIQQKLKHLYRAIKPVTQVLSDDRFYTKKWNGSRPDSDYFDRTAPNFFFNLKDKDQIINFIDRNFADDKDQIIARANIVLAHKFAYLTESPIDFGQQINWHKDYVSNFEFEYLKGTQVKIVDFSNDSDVKRVWELSRLQFLPTLALAFWFTNDRKYYNEYVKLLNNWFDNNLFGYGVNWTCAMEVAIRAINIIWSLNLLTACGCLTDRFVKRVIKQLYYHGLFIENNLEKIDNGSNTNHLVSNYLGLFYIGTFLPEFDRALKWRTIGHKGLEEEMEAEVFTDGADYENSISYHRLVTEMFLHAGIIAKNNQTDFSNEYYERLNNMIRFSQSATGNSGKTMLIGDNDSGVIINLSNSISSSHNDIINIAAAYFDYPVENHIKATPDLCWFTSPEKFESYLDKNKVKATSNLYKESGYAFLRSEKYHLSFNANKVKETHLAGHKHNDNLSITLEYNNQQFLIDPGTYCYTSDPKNRNSSRSTSSHNTVMIDNKEQSPILNNRLFYLNDKSRNVTDLWINTKELKAVSAYHHGYLRNKSGIIHRRTLYAFEQLKSFSIQDNIRGNDNKNHDITTTFVTPFKNIFHKNNAIIIEADNGDFLSLSLKSRILPTFEITPFEYYPAYGVKKIGRKLTFHQSAVLPFSNCFEMTINDHSLDLYTLVMNTNTRIKKFIAEEQKYENTLV